MNKVNKQDIIDTRIANPCFTQQKIGEKYNISREYVRQVLAEKRRSQIHRHEDNIIMTGHIPLLKLCQRCGEELGTRKSSYCKKCYYELHRVPVRCNSCGKLIYKQLGEVIRKDPRYKGHFFCNKICMGQWLGKNYGRGRQKEGISKQIDDRQLLLEDFGKGEESIPKWPCLGWW